MRAPFRIPRWLSSANFSATGDRHWVARRRRSSSPITRNWVVTSCEPGLRRRASLHSLLPNSADRGWLTGTLSTIGYLPVAFSAGHRENVVRDPHRDPYSAPP